MEKMNKVFKEMDVDGDGRVNETDLMQVFKNYGCDVSRATVHNLVRLVDTTGDGTVHWEQFQKVFDILDEVRSNSHFSKEKSEKPESRRTSIVSKEPVKQEAAKDMGTKTAEKVPAPAPTPAAAPTPAPAPTPALVMTKELPKQAPAPV